MAELHIYMKNKKRPIVLVIENKAKELFEKFYAELNSGSKVVQISTVLINVDDFRLAELRYKK